MYCVDYLTKGSEPCLTMNLNFEVDTARQLLEYLYVPGLVLDAFYVSHSILTTLECYPPFQYVIKMKGPKDRKSKILKNPLVLKLIIFSHVVSLWVRI